MITQACELRRLADGNDHLTVIMFDIALYEMAVQLLDAKPDLKGAVFSDMESSMPFLQLSETLVLPLKTLRIYYAWIEADVYVSATTRHNLNCTQYERVLLAHIHSYMALYKIALERPQRTLVSWLDVTAEVKEAYTSEPAEKNKIPESINIDNNISTRF